MAVRKDEVQISVAFITDESKAFAKMIQKNKEFDKELKAAKESGEGLDDVIKKMVKSAASLKNVDLNRLAPAQLNTRLRQLTKLVGKNGLIVQSAPQWKELREEYDRINNHLGTMRRRSLGVSRAQKKMFFEGTRFGRTLTSVFAVFGGITLAGVFQKIVDIGRAMVRVTGETSRYGAVLKNALGSESEAQKALALIQRFTAETPFQLNEVTEAYIKLTNRGLQPTEEELRKLGDIASSQGKSILQLTEAILDATTGEFERLKDIGIVARKNNDEVTLSFKNQKVTVDNNAESIRQAILAFGELSGVQGTMREVSDSAAGALSNMSDNAFQLLNALSEKFGLASAIKGVGRLFKNLTEFIGGTNNATKTAREEVSDLQAQFNTEIAVLKNANFTQEERAKIIGEINKKYGSYIGNLINEKAGIEDIEKAQKQANQAFKERIILISFQEEITRLTKEAAENAGLAFEFEKQRARLASGNFNEQEKVILEGPYGAGRDVVLQQEELFKNLREGALDNVDKINKEIEEVPKIFDSLAKEIGTTLDAIFNRFESKTKDSTNAATAAIKNVKTAIRESIAEPETIDQELPDATDTQLSSVDGELRINDFLKEILKNREQIFSEYEEGRLENASRTESLQMEMLMNTYRSASSFVQAGINLLSKDEAARKKNARVIKAAAKTKILIDLGQEIQGIWKNANSNLINSAVPGWAQAFAAIQIGLATGRAGIQIAQINGRKFAGGGFTGPGFFPDETGHRVAGWVHQDEYVSPTWQIKKYPDLFNWLESDRMRGYNTGGFVGVNTTPSSAGFTQNITGDSGNDFSEEILSEIRMLRKENARRSDTVKAIVILDELNAAQTEYNNIQNEASL